eukprot:TRINITY_DN850_c2_g1_i2.p2 TRINITY_DN850_c2_g1~~TRINITY_DN850_c2_g1_i2.p2  ORF type:complete len:246 (-),score=76.85 TRINITY_DN850_c2_g1_i2:840-1577(-)
MGWIHSSTLAFTQKITTQPEQIMNKSLILIALLLISAVANAVDITEQPSATAKSDESNQPSESAASIDEIAEEDDSLDSTDDSDDSDDVDTEDSDDSDDVDTEDSDDSDDSDDVSNDSDDSESTDDDDDISDARRGRSDEGQRQDPNMVAQRMADAAKRACPGLAKKLKHCRLARTNRCPTNINAFHMVADAHRRCGNNRTIKSIVNGFIRRFRNCKYDCRSGTVLRDEEVEGTSGWWCQCFNIC